MTQAIRLFVYKTGDTELKRWYAKLICCGVFDGWMVDWMDNLRVLSHFIQCVCIYRSLLYQRSNAHENKKKIQYTQTYDDGNTASDTSGTNDNYWCCYLFKFNIGKEEKRLICINSLKINSEFLAILVISLLIKKGG